MSEAVGPAHDYLIVTGAPGAGKSAVVEALLRRPHPFLLYDIDWLATAGSALARSDVITDTATWRPYRQMWFAVLDAAARNQRRPVLFAAINPGDVAALGLSAVGTVRWCLLDCDDQTRRARLDGRDGWAESMIRSALTDAAKLRTQIRAVGGHTIDTTGQGATQTAVAVDDWLRQIQPVKEDEP